MLFTVGISMMLAALFSSVAMVVEHYVPWWQYITGKERLHPVLNYIIGLLGIFLPFTFLTIYWDIAHLSMPVWGCAAALWVIAGAAGLTVIACYGVDSWYIERRRRLEAFERETAWKGGLAGEDEGPAQ